MKLRKKGAEADIYQSKWQNSKAILKIRKIKNYRNTSLDLKIRKQRTIKESQILSQVKSFGIPTPLVYFVNLEKALIVMQEIPENQFMIYLISKLLNYQKKLES